MNLVLSNARIVLRNTVLHGRITVEDGLIAGLDESGDDPSGGVDCKGDYVIPGLVELHTDNLERHMVPRPKVRWPAAAAVLSHDAQIASAGITTVFDAISCGDIMDGTDRMANLLPMIRALEEAQTAGHLRAEHRLHLRCEVSAEGIVPVFEGLVDDPLVGIVSLMDHAPGQRQFVRIDKYRDYYMGKYGMDDAEMDNFTRARITASYLYSDRHRTAIAAIANQRHLVLASHDDATAAHIAESAGLGVQFCEFPTTPEAAAAAHVAGLKVLMGAPNLVRGGSHSGNVSAAALAEAGHLDILSSDYVPFSMIHAAVGLHHGGLKLPLPQAIATVTASPAEAVGLVDRGMIVVGLRADLVRLHDTGSVPVVRTVWRGGTQVA